MTAKKNKIKAALAMLLASSVVLCSCASKGEGTAGYITAQPDGKDYGFSYPDNWKELRSDSMYAIESPDGKSNISSASFGISADVSSIEEYVNGSDTVKGYKQLLSDSFGEMLVITEATPCTLGEREAIKLDYSVSVGEDKYFFSTVLALLPTSFDTLYLYDLTFTAYGEDSFNEHIAVFDGVVSTFTFN